MFLFYIILSFIVGGIWVTLASVAADHLGSKIGGFLAGLPSTIVVALFFIGLIQGKEAVSASTDVVPLAFSVNGPFLILYTVLIRKNFYIAILASLLLWFLLSALIVFLNAQYFTISVIVWLISFIITYLILEKSFHIPSQRQKSKPYSGLQLILRALFSGSVIAFAVIMSKIGGPIYGGIFSTFPAVFLSTIIITYWTSGAQFSRAVAKSMILSGFINVVAFAISLRYLFLYFDLYLSTIAALGITLITGYISSKLMMKKII